MAGVRKMCFLFVFYALIDNWLLSAANRLLIGCYQLREVAMDGIVEAALE